jgi:hypothetical protein
VLAQILRRVAEEGGTPNLPDEWSKPRPRRDQAIGEFLFFSDGPIAERDQVGKRLLDSGAIEAFDLHTLEQTIAELRATPRSIWKQPGGSLEDKGGAKRR